MFTAWLDPVRRFERHYAEFLIARFRALALPGGERIDLERDFIPVRGLPAALERTSPVLVTGEPGVGKTTVLMHLALRHARRVESGSAGAFIPLYLSAREFPSNALPRAVDLPQLLDLSNALAAACPPDFFANAVASGRALVLIDDLDGLPADRVAAVLSEFANTHVVAASRIPLPDLAEFPLEGFGDAQVQALARNWSAENAPAFVAACKSNHVPRALSANPLTLTLLTRVWRSGTRTGAPSQSLPVRRLLLFDEFAQSVLKGAGEGARLFEDVALAERRGSPVSEQVVARGHGFLRACRNHTAEYTHPLWQAYFVARTLRRSPGPAAISDLMNDPRDEETLLFYAGAGDATELVTALLERGEMALAGRAIAHAERVDAALSEKVTRELANRAWQGDAPATRALTELQSESAVDWIGARFKENDPEVRKRAARLLGAFASDRSIDHLMRQLRDPDPDVRDEIVAALGNSRAERVVDPLLVALRGDARAGKVDTRLRAAAARALGQVGLDKAVPALVVDLAMGEPEVQAAAAEALVQIGSPLMLAAVNELAASGDPEGQRYARDILNVVNGKG